MEVKKSPREVFGLKTKTRKWIQIARAIKHSFGKKFYSETGEDSILFDIFKISKGTYLDIGAAHPVIGSNTYGLYRRGWKGTGVDLLAEFQPIWKIMRPKDQFLVGAVTSKSGEVEFVEFENKLLSTLDRDVIEFHKQRGEKFEISKVMSIGINNLIPEKISSSENFVLNIDVEGSELDVLQQMDLSKQRPKVICIESWIVPWEKETPVHKLLTSSSYKLYAYTGLSAFYVASEEVSHLRGIRASLAT